MSYALSDVRIHTYSHAKEIPATPVSLYDATNADYSNYYPVPADTGRLASFGHLFGGYDAGYYSYPWAAALAADLASRFRSSAEGFLDSQLGVAFRKEILERGSSRDLNDSIRAFLGRDWNTDAFFEEMGLAKADDGSSSVDPIESLPGGATGDGSSGSKVGELLYYVTAIIGCATWHYPFFEWML